MSSPTAISPCASVAPCALSFVPISTVSHGEYDGSVRSQTLKQRNKQIFGFADLQSTAMGDHGSFDFRFLLLISWTNAHGHTGYVKVRYHANCTVGVLL
jgi:hypothetical protein